MWHLTRYNLFESEFFHLQNIPRPRAQKPRKTVGGGVAAVRLEWLWGDTLRPRAEKPQQDSRRWSSAVWHWSDFEETTHIQGQRRSPRKTVGGVKSCLESNPILARDTQRSQIYLVHTRTQRRHRDWDRTVFEYLLWGYRSAVDCHRGQGSGCSRVGYGISHLGGVTINPTIVPPEPTQDWETDSWRAHTEHYMHQDPGERSTDPTGDWPRLARECPGVCSRGVDQRWPATGTGALNAAVCAQDILKEVAIIFITSTIVWP